MRRVQEINLVGKGYKKYMRPTEVIKVDDINHFLWYVPEGVEKVTKEMKFDGGKILAGIPFQDFPLALQAVAEVGTFGAYKYERSSWKTVPNAMTRYTDAKFRHILEGEITDRDAESGLLHKAHEAWNALATLQLYIEEKQKEFEEELHYV